VRIIPICCCMGEAAGVAVAVAFASGENVHSVDVKEVKRILRENGAALFAEDIIKQ